MLATYLTSDARAVRVGWVTVETAGRTPPG